ncbi:L-rhamnose mutarotase [Mucilaginibacter sp. RS28]|uniref:L-rhamnose mutarotase n=1 Tax=Mucilaginibacter straminoryzae TaxID=2932774 RepID=A0A9X1X2G6_9SPHI|nr:L-rhamnose mutarotase [Mucilaginibacter straminoryzae]MCJ8210007.1 L-rhamnose mutarotase [Mucilaginibacter straminoryzae]
MRHSICYLLVVAWIMVGSRAKAQRTSTHPIVIEVSGPVGKSLNTRLLNRIASHYRIADSAIYHWKNHLVFYGDLAHTADLQKALAKAYIGAQVKQYPQPFYRFNRQQHCKGAKIAGEWTNIILTANLVKAPAMQQQYLQYHASQFTKWPEVANGFCNADFQQLIVYKSGRQLMLVISIPKGKTLDELNPKTTENNPRVAEWNNIMKKYQEGIAGTKPGETWVFLKPINEQ